MVVTATEFRTNFGKYLELAAVQDIFITRNGKCVARLTSPSANKLECLDSLVGSIPQTDLDVEAIKAERLGRQ